VVGLHELLAGKHFGAVVMDDRNNVYEFVGLTEGYRQAVTLPANERPHTYTGAQTVPATIWLAKESLPPPPPGAKILWDFESGQKDWTTGGAAWGAAPAGEVPGHVVGGMRGSKFASSFHGGEKATGTLTSPPFVLDGAVSIRLAGDADPARLFAELRIPIGPFVLDAATARAAGGDEMSVVTWDTSAWRGATGQIVLVDRSPVGWLAADDVEVLP
jgi:hypothetical protein